MPWFPLLAALILYASAITWEWLPGRFCLRALGISWLATVAFLAATQPDLLRRRNSVPQAGPLSPSWDNRLLHALRGFLLLLLLVAGWQSGRGGTPLDPELFGFGLSLLLAGTLILWASFYSNPFFEFQVRHQSEQGQRVIQTGPYGRIRHPGYLAMFLMLASLPPMLHSSAAIFPCFCCMATLVGRMRREESLLRADLPGYADYMGRVPFRLIPHVW